MKIRFSGIGITLVFSIYLTILGSFGFEKAETVIIVENLESAFSESLHDFNDFGLTQRQLPTYQSSDEVKDSSKSFARLFAPSFSFQFDTWTRLSLLFPSKFSFSDLSILFHNLRI